MKKLYFILLIGITFVEPAMSQENKSSLTFDIYGYLKESKKECINEVEINLFVNDSLLKKVSTNKKGYYEFKLYLNNNYKIEYIKTGYESKAILINTYINKENLENESGWEMPLNVYLKKSNENKNKEILPIAKIHFNLLRGYFDYDLNYNNVNKE